MTFDKLEHKELVLDLINKVSVPGQLIEQFYDLKRAVELGVVTKPHDQANQIPTVG